MVEAVHEEQRPRAELVGELRCQTEFAFTTKGAEDRVCDHVRENPDDEDGTDLREAALCAAAHRSRASKLPVVSGRVRDPKRATVEGSDDQAVP